MLIPKLNSSLLYGGDYNPEQWPEDVWPEDMRLMKEVGVNLVSIAVFSWGRLQPSEEVFDFGWLDRLMDLLAKHGIYACLATSTASPPMWMSKGYPDILAVDRNGRAYGAGSRQHFSPSSRTYRRFATELVGRLADRYKDHPALAAWHVNNEYANHVPECHGADSTEAFRNWLHAKYGSLTALNEAWTTDFWSQTYYNWSEIDTPHRTGSYNNPAQQLDFHRFTSDAFLGLYQLERDSLMRLTPGVPVTTNFMMWFKPMDYWKWAEEVDFVSWDSYPDPTVGLHGWQGLHHAASFHDLMRSLKGGQPFLLIEQSTSGVSWRPVNAIKQPGQMRLWSMQALARGSDGVMFFQWRASRGGAEKFCSAIVSHVGPERSRVFKEIKVLGAELKRLAGIVGSRQTSRTAVIFDWNAWWALELDAKPASIKYAQSAIDAHAYFFRRNIPVDFARPTDDLAGYDLMVAPALYLLTAEGAENLRSFVSRGGTLIFTYFSGIVDQNEQVQCGGYPALLRDVFGLWVEEWVPLQEGVTVDVKFAGSDIPHKAQEWCDLVHLEGASSVAAYTQDYLAGRPAVTKHGFGKGIAYYLGTKLATDSFAKVLDGACLERKITPVFEAPEGVEATMRTNGPARYLFLLNHRPAEVEVPMRESRGIELLTGTETAETLLLAKDGVAVIQLAVS